MAIDASDIGNALGLVSTSLLLNNEGLYLIAFSKTNTTVLSGYKL